MNSRVQNLHMLANNNNNNLKNENGYYKINIDTFNSL